MTATAGMAATAEATATYGPKEIRIANGSNGITPAESTATTEATGTFCEATSPGTLATTGMLAAVGTPATPIRSSKMSFSEKKIMKNKKIGNTDTVSPFEHPIV
jgi:hypothetical protein